MNKSLLFFLMLCLAYSTAVSQSCLPEGITFSSQAQIDSFHVNYPGCTIIEGDVSFAPNIVTSLNGLSGLTAINGDFYIKSTRLLNLSGLDSLTKVGGSFIFHHNNRLRTLIALQNVDSIGGTFELYYSDTLPSLNGLENLTYVGDSLWIDHLDSIVNLSGLENLSHVGNLIFIYENDNLVSLEGLNGLDSILSIYIHDNNVLTDVSALGNLDTIPGYLSFGHNDILPGFFGLNSIKSIKGGLRVTNNDAIADLEGFDSLNYAGFLLIGSPDVGGNESLSSLSGLGNLKHINGDLIISRNPMLVDLSALTVLDSIAGYIEITHNTGLTSLNGLDNIAPHSISDLTITDNWSLSNCEVESICYYLLAPGGTVDIDNNDPGCNSREEVEVACGPILIAEKPGFLNFAIFPNPSSNQFKFSIQAATTIIRIQVMNTLGQVVFDTREDHFSGRDYQVTWDASAIPAGIYLFRMMANGQTSSGKIILN